MIIVGGQGTGWLRVYTFWVVAFCVVFLRGVTLAYADSAAGEARAVPLLDRLREGVDRFLVRQCLTPAAGRVLEELVAAGALRPVLGNELTLERVDLTADQIELGIQDRNGHSYLITLALRNSMGSTPDGKGTHFLFYLAASPDPPNLQAKTALLAAAALFDQAVPATLLERCSGDGERRGEDRRFPRALILASAIFEVAALVGAILFGVRVLRRPI